MKNRDWRETKTNSENEIETLCSAFCSCVHTFSIVIQQLTVEPGVIAKARHQSGD